MKALERNKGVLAALVIFALAMFFYRSFFKIDLDPLSVDSSAARNIAGSLIETRAKLQSANLNQEIFSKEAYKMLVDFTIPIPEQPVGRPNPFDVLGRN